MGGLEQRRTPMEVILDPTRSLVRLSLSPQVTLHLIEGGGHFDLPFGWSLPARWRARLVPTAEEALAALARATREHASSRSRL